MPGQLAMTPNVQASQSGRREKREVRLVQIRKVCSFLNESPGEVGWRGGKSPAESWLR